MDISKYKSVGEWYEDARKNGYSVPLAMCQGLSQLMEKRNLSFQGAYNFLIDKEKVVLKGKVYFYNLSSPKLWEEGNSE